MSKNKRNIAYIAPEIPALSATFVYNEIASMEELGHKVTPLSVHKPQVKASDPVSKELEKKMIRIYGRGFLFYLFFNLTAFIRNPYLYLKALLYMLKDISKLKISRLSAGILYRFIVASWVSTILRRKKTDHIHIHFAHVPCDIGMYASLLSGIPFSFTSHANDIFERGWLLKQKVDRSKFAVTISDHNRKYIERVYSPTKEIEVLHCGVNTVEIKTKPKNPIGKVLKIGSLGRFVEKKGFDTLVKTALELKKNGVEFTMEIAGDGPYYKEIYILISKLKLTSNVFLTGKISHNKVADFLSNLDIFILPCKKDSRGDMDGIPVVLMEAMLCGTPVISTNISGIPELIKNGKTGICISPDSPDEAAQAILKISSDNKFRNNIVRNSLKKIKSDFNQMANTKRLSKLINDF
ncbi:MAG: glycosyltransferase family 4 protein [Desulfobacterales bacterium]|nr:glycosyltransferase family 4 protein [Desulfobacterales bacterium]